MRGDIGADVAAFTDDVVAGLHEGKDHTLGLEIQRRRS